MIFTAQDFKQLVAEVIDLQWYSQGPEAIADKANAKIAPILASVDEWERKWKEITTQLSSSLERNSEALAAMIKAKEEIIRLKWALNYQDSCAKCAEKTRRAILAGEEIGAYFCDKCADELAEAERELPAEEP